MAQPRVLVIDDSELVLAAVRLALTRAGYAVATVMTVDEFEAERRREPPDVIVIDVQMPELFGDDLALTIREVYGEAAPIVLLSGIDEAELAERAKAIHAQAWVPKRLGMTALVDAIGKIVPG